MESGDAGELDRSKVHDDHLSTAVEHQLGRCRPHAGGATDHEDALVVVAERVEKAHAASPLVAEGRCPSDSLERTLARTAPLRS